MSAENEASRGPKQKYWLIYMGDVGLTFDVFDYKWMLKKKIKKMDPADIKGIIKGKDINLVLENVLTVA